MVFAINVLLKYGKYCTNTTSRQHITNFHIILYSVLHKLEEIRGSVPLIKNKLFQSTGNWGAPIHQITEFHYIRVN